MDIKKAVQVGLSLAESGRRNREVLNGYFYSIYGNENHEITFRDTEDGSVFTLPLSEIPYMGNKSARLSVIVSGC